MCLISCSGLRASVVAVGWSVMDTSAHSKELTHSFLQSLYALLVPLSALASYLITKPSVGNNSLEVVLAHLSVPVVPIHTFYALICSLLTWIVVLGHSLAVPAPLSASIARGIR